LSRCRKGALFEEKEPQSTEKSATKELYLQLTGDEYQIDYLAIPNVPCILDSFSYYDKLRITTLLPFILVAGLAVPSLLAGRVLSIVLL